MTTIGISAGGSMAAMVAASSASTARYSDIAWKHFGCDQCAWTAG